MGKILDWIENKEHLKIGIIEYEEGELSIINYSEEYYLKHWRVFKRKTDKKRIPGREFFVRLHDYLWVSKISELLIILYLEDLKGNHPIIYEINRLLRRTENQYSATLKSVKKLEDLDIIYTKPVEDSSRKKKQVFINKNIVKIYGDDEFRQMMLDEWDIGAREYIKRKLDDALADKAKFEKRIKMIKKRKRVKVKKDGRDFV